MTAPAPAPRPSAKAKSKLPKLRAPPALPKLKENLVLVDVAAVLLAVASAVILFAARTLPLAPAERVYLVDVDYAAIVLFAILFVGRALVARSFPRFVRRHFFDLFGLFPITTPLLGFDRWWTFLGVLIVLARLSMALDRAFGERVLARVFERYRAALVEELTEPILVRLVVVLREALTSARYMESIGETLDSRRGDIHEIVRKSIEASPKLKFVRSLPGMEKKLDETVEELVTSAVVALTSEEMNRLVADAIAKALTDLEAKVAEPTWKERGLGVGDVVSGLTRRA